MHPILDAEIRPTDMKLSEITSYPRPWKRATFPFVAHVEIDAARWGDFQSLIEDQTQLRILGHDLADDDQLVVHIACTTEHAKNLVESRWGA